MCGVSSFVYQEEFDRYTGYWWSPKTEQSGNETVYRIVFTEEDEENVDVYRVTDFDQDNNTEDARYPLAGHNNPTITLCLVEFTKDRVISSKKIAPSLKDRYPWLEYLVKIGWFPDGKQYKETYFLFFLKKWKFCS